MGGRDAKVSGTAAGITAWQLGMLTGADDDNEKEAEEDGTSAELSGPALRGGIQHKSAFRYIVLHLVSRHGPALLSIGRRHLRII